MQSTQTRSVFMLHVGVGKRSNSQLKTHLSVQVVQKIGLCISLYDVLWTSEGLIGHGTGLVNVNGMAQ